MRDPLFRNAHIRLIVAALYSGRELSAEEAGEVAFVSTRHARRLLLLLKREGLIHIDRWEGNKRGPAHPIYAIGMENDAERPEPQSAAWRAKRYRDRRRIPQPDPLTRAFKEAK